MTSDEDDLSENVRMSGYDIQRAAEKAAPLAAVDDHSEGLSILAALERWFPDYQRHEISGVLWALSIMLSRGDSFALGRPGSLHDEYVLIPPNAWRELQPALGAPIGVDKATNGKLTYNDLQLYSPNSVPKKFKKEADKLRDSLVAARRALQPPEIDPDLEKLKWTAANWVDAYLNDETLFPRGWMRLTGAAMGQKIFHGPYSDWLSRMDARGVDVNSFGCRVFENRANERLRESQRH